MQHIAQAHNECQLVTLAMLQDKDVAEVRHELIELAKQISGKQFRTWNSVINHGLSYDALRQYAARYAIEFPAHFKTIHGIKLPVNGSDVRNYVSDLTVDMLQGKGQLTVAKHRGRDCHAVAYHDGLIYDGNADGPLTIADWQKQFPMWAYVIVQPWRE